MFNVYARIKHTDGQIEERRLWLEKLSREEAESQAQGAMKMNPDDGSGRAVVLDAWVESADQQFSPKMRFDSPLTTEYR